MKQYDFLQSLPLVLFRLLRQKKGAKRTTPIRATLFLLLCLWMNQATLKAQCNPNVAIIGNNSNAAIEASLDAAGYNAVNFGGTVPPAATLATFDVVLLLRTNGNADLDAWVAAGGLIITEWSGADWVLNTQGMIDATVGGGGFVGTGTPLTFTGSPGAAIVGAGLPNPYSDGAATEFFRFITVNDPATVETMATYPGGPAIIGGAYGCGYALVMGFDWADGFPASGNIETLLQNATEVNCGSGGPLSITCPGGCASSGITNVAIIGNNSNAAIEGFLDSNGYMTDNFGGAIPSAAVLAGYDAVILLRTNGNADLDAWVAAGGLLITEWTGADWALNTQGMLDATVGGGGFVGSSTPVTFTGSPNGIIMGMGLPNPYSDPAATEFFRFVTITDPSTVETIATYPGGPAIIGGNYGSGYALIMAYDWADSFPSLSSQILLNALGVETQECVPFDTVYDNDPGQCGANITIPLPLVEGCGTVTVVNDFNGLADASGFYPVGTTTVTFTATDATGATASCSIDITVNDIENPTITCPGNINVNNDSGQCGANVNIPVPTNGDNCAVATVINDFNGTNNASGFYPVGTTTVTYTVTDVNGHTAMCSFDVTVTDTENPTISCPANINVNNDPGQCGANVNIPVPANGDNCAVATVVNDFNGTNDASGFYPVGTTTVTYTVTDIYGNTAMCSFDVTVTDTENPTISCPANINVNNDAGQCGANVNIPVPANGDNCAVATIVNDFNGTNDASGFYPVGLTTVNYTITDIYGNTAMCSFNVVVTDNMPPSLTCWPDANGTTSIPGGNCTGYVPFPILIPTDNCGILSVSNSFNGTDNASDNYPVGTTTVTFTVIDINGNVSTCDFDVTVIDDSPPTANCPANQVLTTDPFGCTYTAQGGEFDPFTMDNCGVATVVNDYNGGSTLDGAVFNVGTVTIQWTVTDIHGNVNTCTFDVTVNDNDDPQFLCPTFTDKDTDPGVCTYTATGGALDPTFPGDNCAVASIVNDYNNGSTLDGEVFAPGSYPITWTITDVNGNTIDCSFSLTVTDNEPPTINCPAGPIVRNTDPGACRYTVVGTEFDAVFADNCGVMSLVNDLNNANTLAGFLIDEGSYSITWTGTDSNGNTVSCTFNLDVVDNEPPILTCPPDPILLSTDPGVCTYTTQGAELDPFAFDNCALQSLTNDYNNSFTLAGAVFLNTATVVNWTLIDAQGNMQTCSNTIIVTDTEDPVLNNCPTDINICVPEAYWTLPTASDNCNATLTASHSPGDTFPIGTTAVTYTATDPSGNNVSCSFNVTYQPLDITVTPSNYGGFGVSALGATDGFINVVVNVGTGPFVYTWSPPGLSGANPAGLGAGVYNLTVTDANGCMITETIILTQPNSVVDCNVFNINDPSCAGSNDGSISAMASGGVGPYTYNWSGPGGPYTGTTISGLDAGTYTLTVTDSNGSECYQTVNLVGSGALQVSPAYVAVNDQEGQNGGVGIYFYNLHTILFEGGTAPYNYEWEIDGFVRHSVDGPGQLTVLYADDAIWSVTITDANGCGGVNGPLVFSNDILFNGVEILDIECYEVTACTTPGATNGIIDLMIEGGTGVYNYNWTGPYGFTSNLGPVLTGLSAGWYAVTITDTGDGQITEDWFWVGVEGGATTDCEGNINGGVADCMRCKTGVTAQLHIAPNPFSEQLQIEFILPETGALTEIHLYDIHGRKISQLFSGEVLSDTPNTLTYQAANLAAGMYILELTTEDGLRVKRKLIKATH